MSHSATTTRVLVPPTTAVPRGAKFVALLVDLAKRSAANLKARREARLRAEEADFVRRYARDVLPTHPSLAADLFAAADRHVGPN